MSSSSIDHGQIINSLSEEICGSGRELTNLFAKDIELSDTKYIRLYIATCVLFYILCDRIAFDSYSEEQRNGFADWLADQTISKICTLLGVNEDAVRRTWNENIKALAPHSQRLTSEDGIGRAKGTLMWEFSENVRKISKKLPLALIGSMYCMMIGTEFIKSVRPRIEKAK